MNRELRRRRDRDHKAQAAEQIEKLEQARDSLLDIINAIVQQEGGSYVIPLPRVQAATRHAVHVEVKPPDPETAGDEGRYVITLEGFEPPAPPEPKGAVERLRGRIWLPGQS